MALVEQQRKVDRDEVFLEYTKSICPVCKAVVDAEVNIRDNRVLLRKRCPQHGRFEALVYSDAELYLRQQRFNKPGTLPLAFQTELKDGCPLDCGLCPDHKQHSCLGLIEVNTGCNLDCPVCFADSGHQPDGYALTREQVAFMLDTFVAAEGNPEVIQFSGGEPTIHPQIVEFVAMAQARGIGRVMLNTNGIRLAKDRRLLADLAPLMPDIYLQFDGFELRTHTLIRGRDLREMKDYLDYVANRIAPDPAVREALEKMFSSSATPGAERALLACEGCGIDLPGALKDVEQRFFMLVVQDFQDAYTLNVRQLMKCCVAEITPDGRLIPFCAY